MSLNLRTYDREVYHSLDWLGDMGGLYDGLRGILALIVGFFTYKKYDTFMVAQLYQQKVDNSNPGQQGGQHENKLIRGLTNFFK